MAELDDFWDIASLMPKKKKSVIAAPVQEPVSFPSPQAFSDTEKTVKAEENISLKEREVTLIEEYEITSHPFLRGARVYSVTSPFHFYHGFQEAAALSLSSLGKNPPCAFEPFFSYSPQYAQLSQKQMSYYLYFRDCAYEGRYIKTTKNYLLLFIYEILNSPNLIPKEEGALLLARLWAAYRGAFPQVDKYMREWLVDYCLLYRVPFPYKEIMSFLPALLEEGAWKEFYLGFIGEASQDTKAAIRYFSKYDPYTTRMSQREELFSMLHHIEKALIPVFPVLLQIASREKNMVSLKSREVFLGAVWAGALRYRIEVSYQPHFAALRLAEELTAAVKYAENCLRMRLHIKSRLMVREVPPAVKELIDGYFEKAFPRKEEPLPRPVYEAQYDAESCAFSATEAEKIENDSWQNTRLLVSEEELAEVFASCDDEEEAPPEPERGAPLSDAALRFLSALWQGEGALANEIAKEANTQKEALAEEINDYFSDTMGDIVLDMTAEGIFPIADYNEEIAGFLRAYM
ncbi:MAG: TerB N-terminal domain-containing protein [Clostridia bacterium]|nr:TerB N-terminal domain-containing protein [Clostridia bacterium]